MDDFQRYCSLLGSTPVVNCLVCQNWHFREVDPVASKGLSARELAGCANARTYCVCFFGGDPASQMLPKLMDRAVQLSLETGGTVKFDLKAFNSQS